MKLKFSLIAAMLAVAGLTACGGSDDNAPELNIPVASPAVLSKTEVTLGTGAEAVAGKTVAAHYTVFLYSDTAVGNKGPKVDSSAGRDPLSFVVGGTGVIAGFSEGVTGMRVGGKRTVLVPASLAYGAAGKGSVPPNSGLVFDLELVTVN